MEFESKNWVSGRPDSVRLAEAHAGVNRSVLAVLDLIVELDKPETRLANSVADMTSWLGFDLGVDRRTARMWARVAHALVDLPVTRRAFHSGAVAFDQVGILCQYATAENERELLEFTRDTPTDELAAALREHLDIESARRSRRDRSPWLKMSWNEQETHLKLRGEIPGVDGLMVETALRRVASRAPLDEVTGLHRDADVSNGGALVQIASEAAAADRDHDRATLVVHFNAADLGAGFTSGMVGEQLIDRDELLRLSCDARLQPAIDDPSGVTVGVGRATRKIPPWLRRLVEGRDGGCRFPGCGRTRWTHAHHIIHWADDGPTNLDNLITLCGFHHRLIHKQGWGLEGNPNGDVVFINQWGKVHEPARPRFHRDHVQELLAHLDHYESYRRGRLATANSPP
jgi:hypothetical protein